jgi:hypothetical protein
MKFGFKNMLGLGFVAAMMGLGGGAKGSATPEPTETPFFGGGRHFTSPIFSGKSQKTKKSNRKRLANNAKLKRRRAK